MRNLRDRVVVITGAGSGIGRATALACAAEGARVAVCDIDQPRLDTLARELGERALVVKRVDVAKRSEVEAFAADVHASVEAADVVVNNAGVAVGGTFVDSSLDDIDWLLGINLHGVLYGCHAFAPSMIARGSGGQIVNLSSILGIWPPPNVSAYVASKFAVRGFSLSLRAELAPYGIGVTALCPGLIATAIVDDGRIGKVGVGKTMVSDVFRRGMSPDRVARAILECVRTNPAVRLVGPDAHVLAALDRVAPRVLDRLGSTLQRRLGLG